MHKAKADRLLPAGAVAPMIRWFATISISQAIAGLRKNKDVMHPASKMADTTNSPSDVFPVAFVIKPRILGPTIPPSTPNELIVAIAVAAATPVNIPIGYVHNGGIADRSPAVPTDKAISMT